MGTTEVTAITQMLEGLKPEKFSMVRVSNGYGEDVLACVIVIGREEIGCALKAGTSPLHWFKIGDRGITWQPARLTTTIETIGEGT